jgi:hypothetical protein
MGTVTATIWEMCEREKYRLQSIPGLTRIVDVCTLYGLNPATVCNVYYQWRKASEEGDNEQSRIEFDGEIDTDEARTV